MNVYIPLIFTMSCSCGYESIRSVKVIELFVVHVCLCLYVREVFPQGTEQKNNTKKDVILSFFQFVVGIHFLCSGI